MADERKKVSGGVSQQERKLILRRQRVQALKVWEARQLGDSDVDLREDLKMRCARAGVPYEAVAIDAALAFAKRRLS